MDSIMLISWPWSLSFYKGTLLICGIMIWPFSYELWAFLINYTLCKMEARWSVSVTLVMGTCVPNLIFLQSLFLFFGQTFDGCVIRNMDRWEQWLMCCPLWNEDIVMQSNEISAVQHYEYAVLCKANNLQTDCFWAASLAAAAPCQRR